MPLATAGPLIGMLLSVLDQTVVAIALPGIAADLGGMDAIGWVVTSYVLASTATGALYGRLSDRFGRRPVFLAPVAVFVADPTLRVVLPATALLGGSIVYLQATYGMGATQSKDAHA